MPTSTPDSPADPRCELVDLIDRDDRVIGRARRPRVRALNLLHRGVGIVCYDPRGAVYVHRRTRTKDVFPGLYDMLVGGVVASGETYDESAAREIAEELGIRGPTPALLCHYLYIGPRNRSRVAVYEVEWGGPIHHQPEEVEWGAWMAPDQLERALVEHRFVPDGLEIWRHLERHGLRRP